jgi:hypothetical protein
MKRSLTTLILPLFAVICAQANACQCVRETPPTELHDKATIVFAGVVESVKHYDYDRELGVLSGQTEWIFRVGQVWKGPPSKTFRILCEENPSDCGCGFEIGWQYMVYADSVLRQNEFYRSGLCMRPSRIEDAVWDRAVLKDPTVVDRRLWLPKPTIEYLTILADREDRLGRQAKRALQDLKVSADAVDH